MAGIEDQFTGNTRSLFGRMQNTLIQFISVREGQLKLYKEIGNKKLIDLATTELLELKADLEQLKNL